MYFSFLSASWIFSIERLSEFFTSSPSPLSAAVMCCSLHHNKRHADIKTPPSRAAQPAAVFLPAAFDAIFQVLSRSIELVQARGELDQQANRVFHIRDRNRFRADPTFSLIMVVVQRYRDAAGDVAGELVRRRLARAAVHDAPLEPEAPLLLCEVASDRIHEINHAVVEHARAVAEADHGPAAERDAWKRLAGLDGDDLHGARQRAPANHAQRADEALLLAACKTPADAGHSAALELFQRQQNSGAADEIVGALGMRQRSLAPKRYQVPGAEVPGSARAGPPP